MCEVPGLEGTEIDFKCWTLSGFYEYVNESHDCAQISKLCDLSRMLLFILIKLNSIRK